MRFGRSVLYALMAMGFVAIAAVAAVIIQCSPFPKLPRRREKWRGNAPRVGATRGSPFSLPHAQRP
jgi:hypothetical protein